MHTIAAEERQGQAQRAHLLHHRSALCVHAAKKQQVGVQSLDLGEDRGEVGGFVGGEFVADDGGTSGHSGFFKFIRQTLTVGCAVVDDRNVLSLHFAYRKLAQHAALLRIVRHHAECILETLLGVSDVGGGGGNLRNLGVGVNAGGGNRGAGIEVANNRVHFFVDEFLRHGGGNARIGLIVFRQQLEFHRLAADHRRVGIQLFDGQPHAVFVVLAQVCLRSRHGRCVAHLDRKSAV